MAKSNFLSPSTGGFSGLAAFRIWTTYGGDVPELVEHHAILDQAAGRDEYAQLVDGRLPEPGPKVHEPMCLRAIHRIRRSLIAPFSPGRWRRQGSLGDRSIWSASPSSTRWSLSQAPASCQSRSRHQYRSARATGERGRQAGRSLH